MGNSVSTNKTKLQRAEKTGVLVLQRSSLTSVPDAVLKIATLRTLDLSHNAIKTLSASIGALSQSLTSLNLSHNQIASLDPKIGALSRLELLDLSNNKLTTLPPPIVGCTRLRKLHLDRNLLESLPAAIGDLRALELLTAAHNRLAAVPDDFGRLAALVEADLSANDLALLPPTLGGCKRLRVLKLVGNASLSRLPTELLTDTPLDRVEVDPQLLGGNGLLTGEGSDAYNERRRALKDKEIAAKYHGGDVKWST